MSDPILISQIIQSEGLTGKNAELRRAELEKISNTKLQELLSSSEDKTGFNGDFYGEMGWTPKAKPQPKYTPAQTEAMGFMGDMLKSASDTMNAQAKKDNWVSHSVNFVKETFNTEYAKSNVEASIDSTRKDFETLQDAARKVPSEFEAAFQQLRGVKFDEKKIAECSQKAKDMAEFQGASDTIDGLKTQLSSALVNNSSNNISRAGEKAILKTLSTMGYTKIGEVIQAAMKGHENDPAVKNYMKEGGKFAVRKDKNGQTGIYRETEKGGWQPITQEQAQIIGKEIELRLNKLHSEILGVEIPANATSKEIAELNQTRLEKYRADYEKSFSQAYGKKDLKQLSENYMMSQEQGQAYVQMGVNILAMAGAMFSGGGTLALVSTGVMLTNPVGFIQMATDADGMTAKDWKAYGEGALEQTGWMALGMGAGKVGDLTRSFVKVKGLSKVIKESGKSFDDFIKIAAKSPDIPANMAKSLKTVSRLANTAGVTTEVAADMATTIALQKDGATEMDWAMSIGGALVGTKMQKVLAPMTKDAKVKHIMETFKDFKLDEKEANHLLKALDDAASGAAPVKKTNVSDFNTVKSEIFNLEVPIEDIINDHDLWVINGEYNDKLPKFIKTFYDSHGIKSLKENTNYVIRDKIADLPDSFKTALKEKGIDIDKMGAFLQEDLHYDYNQKLPSQESFTNIFKSFLANNTDNSTLSKSQLQEFITKINPDTKKSDVQKILKEFDNLLNSNEFSLLSNDDKTVAKTVQMLNLTGLSPDKEVTALINNLKIPTDTKDRILNLYENKMLIKDLAENNVDMDYAAAVLRNKKDLNIAFIIADRNVSDKSGLQSLRQKLVEHIDKNTVDHGSPVMQTFIDPKRIQTDETTGIKYVKADENDVMLVHSVLDYADSLAEDNIKSLLNSTENPSEKNYISTSIITRKSEVFANSSAYGVVMKNRGKNTVNAGIGQSSGYNHTYNQFAQDLSGNYEKSDMTRLKQYVANNLEQSGIILSDKDYGKLIESINNNQYFSQITQDIDINGTVIKADVLKDAVENANKRLANDILYGAIGNNEITSIVDGIDAIYARVDDISDVKPEIIELAKENGLKVILLGDPEKFKQYNYKNDPQYLSEIAEIQEKFKNKQISGAEWMSARQKINLKYEKRVANTSTATISGGGATASHSLKGADGKVISDVETMIPTREAKPEIKRVNAESDKKEFLKKTLSITDTNGNDVISEFTAHKLIEVYGEENVPKLNKLLDDIKTKYNDDEFAAKLFAAYTTNQTTIKSKDFEFIRKFTDSFEDTPTNREALLEMVSSMNKNQKEAAQILLDMPKRELYVGSGWTDLKSLTSNLNLFKDNQSLNALKRASGLIYETGICAYSIDDLHKIKSLEGFINNNELTDKEILNLKVGIYELIGGDNPANAAKIFASKENKALLAELKEALQNDKLGSLVEGLRNLKPKVKEKMIPLVVNAIQDKTLKSLVKRNLSKIDNPKKQIKFVDIMAKNTDTISQITDKRILSKIADNISKIAENVDNGKEVSRLIIENFNLYNSDLGLQGKDTYIFGNAKEYMQKLEIYDSEQAKVFKNAVEQYEKLRENEYHKFVKDSKLNEKYGYEFVTSIVNYSNDRKIESLKKYYSDIYSNKGSITDKQKAFADKLYKEKYLSTLPEETAAMCEKIHDSFGVKMFLSENNETDNLNLVYNELFEWQKAGKGNATMPPVLDLSLIKADFVNSQVIGNCVRATKNINIRGSYQWRIISALRHEMAHANDSKVEIHSGVLDVHDSKGAVTESLNIDEIIVHGDDDVPDFDKCKYVNEFIKAGFSDSEIEYAYKNKAEFLAVAAEGDYSKYSKEFKDLLVKLGLPKWMFKMKNKTDISEMDNLYVNEKFSKNYSPRQNQSISSNSEALYNMVVQNKNAVENDFKDIFTLPDTNLQMRVKDLYGINEKIYREIDRLDDKIAEVSDIESYNAKKLKKGDEPLTQEMADVLIEKYNIDKKNLINNYEDVYNTLQDTFGARLVMDDTSPAAVEKVLKSLLEGIDSGKFKILEINNYQGAGSIPYFSSAQIKQIQTHGRRQGYEIRVISDVNAPKGKEAQYKNMFNSEKAVKSSGYTTFQVNIEHKNGVISEFQIRGKEINELAESEHIFYDISQKKDLCKGNKELKMILDPLIDVVNEMNLPENENVKKAYSNYLTECYKFARMKELGITAAAPKLPEIVHPMLNIGNIINIHSMIVDFNSK